MDITTRISILLENNPTDIKSKRAKAMNLKHLSFGKYIDNKHNVYSWDDATQNFKKSPDKKAAFNSSSKMDKIIDHFVKHFGMKSVGGGKLSDGFGQIWMINEKDKKLVKVDKNKGRIETTEKSNK